MKKSELIKQKLIDTTIDLMVESDGDINQITTRKITERANVGVGLLNYHFTSKDNLIEVAVERFVSKKIIEFRPDHKEEDNSIDKIKKSLSAVNDFMMDNESISRISILKDHINPSKTDNTISTLLGLKNSLSNYNDNDEHKNIMLFTLVSFAQNVFLRKDQSVDLFGFDYNNKVQRDDMFNKLVDKLLNEHLEKK